MKPQTLDGFDLSSAAFWGRPQAERYEAYAALRQNPSLPRYAEPPVPVFRRGLASTQWRDTQTSSR
jgi:hypothetical protein